jgi:hypothetical protein
MECHAIAGPDRRDRIRAQLTGLMVRVGDVHHAEALARSIVDPRDQAEALAWVAAKAEDIDHAESIALSITEVDEQAAALASPALLSTPDRARRYILTALSLAEWTVSLGALAKTAPDVLREIAEDFLEGRPIAERWPSPGHRRRFASPDRLLAVKAEADGADPTPGDRTLILGPVEHEPPALRPVSRSPSVASGAQVVPREAEAGVGPVTAGDRRQRGEGPPGRRAVGQRDFETGLRRRRPRRACGGPGPGGAARTPRSGRNPRRPSPSAGTARGCPRARRPA